jgi:hypothetical protein
VIENFLRRPESAGDYAADFLRVVGVVGILVAAIGWQPTDAGIVAFALPALVLPRFLGVRGWFDIVFGAVVIVAAWSNVLDLYRTVAGWDLVVHFVCTAVIAVIVYLLFAELLIVPHPRGRAFTPRVPIVLATTIGLAVSALWEMVEWAGYTFISEEIFVAYADTIGDMAVGALGAVGGGILLAYVPLLRD